MLIDKYKFLCIALSCLALPYTVFANYLTAPVESVSVTAYFDHEQNNNGIEKYYDGDDGSVHDYDEHNGTDLVGDIGDDILAPHDGEIINTYFDTCGGYTMHIWHDDIDLSTLYAHLDSYVVATSSIVSRYEHIAEMGASGDPSCVTGVHLHFGVVDDEDLSIGNRIDPFGWTGTTTDPWPYNQGYLWTTNPPSFATVFEEEWEDFTGTITGNAPWSGVPGKSSFSVSSGQGVGGSNAFYSGSYSSKGNRVATSTGEIDIQGTDFDLWYYIRPDNLTGSPNNDAGSIVFGLGDGVNAVDISMTFFRPFGTPGRVGACGRNMNATSTGLGCFYAPAGTSWAGVPHQVRITREGNTTCFRMWPTSDPMPSSCQLTRYEITPSTLTQMRVDYFSNRWRNTAIDDIILYTTP